MPMTSTQQNTVITETLSSELQAWFERRLQWLLDAAAGSNGRSPKMQSQSKRLTENEQARLILGKLSNVQFCKTRPSDTEHFLRVIHQAIKTQTPIPFILGYGPVKNLNNALDPVRPVVDAAEFFALSYLAKLTLTIQQWHSPGVAWTFYLDDKRAQMANGISREATQAYASSLKTLIEQTGFNPCVQSVTCLGERLYRDFQVEAYLAQALDHATDWVTNPENQREYESLKDHAQKNQYLSNMGIDKNTDLVSTAVLHYLQYLEAEKMAGIWSQPDTLYARYSYHPGYLQLFTLRKGSVSQPWQGRGAVIYKEKLDPTILTRNNENRWHEIGQYQMIPFIEALQTVPVMMTR
ncbi:MAG: L-tyrosine/L-tryptophan isonitrile synthase family protein [Cyanobacteria bacterium]|nr:L-tyrosine/L-tryptophan isonitrile synthase family protein [Cyanobacteriota bacterium]